MASSLNRVLEKQFVFVVGAPRSGTTWLQNCLAAHPQVAGHNTELRHFADYTKQLYYAWDKESGKIDNRTWRVGLPTLWSEEEFHEFILEFTKRVYVKVLEKKPDASHILDKFPGYSLHLDDILRVVPSALFVHVVRDGRDAIASLMSAKERIGFGFNEIIDASNYWKNCVSSSLNFEETHPNQMKTVAYEELKSRNVEVLSEVLAFLNLSTDSRVIQQIAADNDREFRGAVSSPDPNFEELRKAGVKPWQTTLNDQQIHDMYKVIGPLLLQLGYMDDQDKYWYNGYSKEGNVERFKNFLKRK